MHSMVRYAMISMESDLFIIIGYMLNINNIEWSSSSFVDINTLQTLSNDVIKPHENYNIDAMTKMSGKGGGNTVYE